MFPNFQAALGLKAAFVGCVMRRQVQLASLKAVGGKPVRHPQGSCAQPSSSTACHSEKSQPNLSSGGTETTRPAHTWSG